jgi:hypothetical protein
MYKGKEPSRVHHLVQIQYDHTLEYTQTDKQYHHLDKHLLSTMQYKNGPVCKLRPCSFCWNLAHADADLLWEKNIIPSLKSTAEVVLKNKAYHRWNITSEAAPIIEIFLEFVFPRSLGWSLPQLTVFQTQIVKCKNNSTHYLYRCSSTAGSNAQVCKTPYQYFFILLWWLL